MTSSMGDALIEATERSIPSGEAPRGSPRTVSLGRTVLMRECLYARCAYVIDTGFD